VDYWVFWVITMIRCGNLERLNGSKHCRGESLYNEEGLIFALYTLVLSVRD
jgi:hypothetical protein